MKIFYIFAHPIKKTSFNFSLLEIALKTLRKDHTLIFKDLYEEKFDPVLKFNEVDQLLDADINNIIWADIIILQFPVWWYSAPAILKGWIDKVLKEGVAYDNDHKFETGFWNDKKFFYICTAGGKKENYELLGRYSLEMLLTHLDLSFKHCGLKALENFIVYDLYNMNQQRAIKIFQELETKLKTI